MLAGRRALVTGGASGIGLATARLLRERGAEVVLLDERRDALTAAAAEIGARARCSPTSATRPRSRRRSTRRAQRSASRPACS